MHFLLVHHVFLTTDSAGGTRHYEFARYCASRGHQFTVIGSDVNYLDAKKFAKERRFENVDGIRVIRARMPAFIHKSYTLRVIAFVLHMFSSFWHALWQRRVDLVIGTSPSLFQAVTAYVISVIKWKPYLLEIRDLWPDFAVEMGVLKSPFLIYWARQIEVFLYRRAKHILVNSPAYVDHIRSKGIDSAKITLIPNGVDSNMFDPNERGENIRSKLNLGSRFVVVYAGAIGPANDIQTIVRAADKLRDHPEICFVLVGDGKSRPQIAELIKSLGLTNVVLAGAYPKNEMGQILGMANACVATLQDIPMFRTTYPNKVFDYMAAGRPTLLAIDGVIREVVESSKGGLFVKPGDSQDLAEKTLQLFQNPELCKQMGRQAREYVQQHFDRQEHAVAFEQLCTTVARKSRSS